MLLPFDDKRGRAECRVGLSIPGKDLKIFQGQVEGQIVEPRGSGGFGWDSLFLPQGHNQTYAEMSQDLKNAISDRFLAVNQLKEFLQSNI
jgi:inosine triphosphate pyrophosphatase